MKKSLTLLCSLLVPAYLGADTAGDSEKCACQVVKPQKITPIELQDPVLDLVDGTGLVDVPSIVHFVRQVYRLQTVGCVTLIDPVTGEHTELTLECKGCPCSIVHVAQAQQQNPQDPAVQQAHKRALDMFTEISRPYVEQVRSSKEYMMRLIKVWSEMRNRPNTDLLNWGSCVNEEADFYRNMDTPERFCCFLEDLRCFLVDMLNTCKKSWKMYDEMRKGIHTNQPA